MRRERFPRGPGLKKGTLIFLAACLSGLLFTSTPMMALDPSIANVTEFGRGGQHRDERRLELSMKDLLELQTALHAMGDKPVRETHDSFIVYPR